MDLDLNNIVQKLYSFIIYLVRVIQDLVKNVSGRADTETTANS